MTTTGSDLSRRLTDRPNILANMEKLVKDEYASGNIPTDAKLAIVNTFDTTGVKIVGVIALKPIDTEVAKIDVKIKAIFEHDWDGDNSVAGQVVFTVR